MTLNITVVSPTGIHQSADFRVSKTEKDADGNWVELLPNASKIVPLTYEKWFGFVTYCGVGLWNGKKTDQYVTEWLSGLAPSPTFMDVVQEISASGSNWIRGINESLTEPFRHSFVLAGFERGVPSYAIVSNCQSLTRLFRALARDLVPDIRVTKDLHVLITGIPAAVCETAQHE